MKSSIDTPTSAPPGQALSRAQWLVLVAAFLGWMFDGLQQGVMPLVARPALQDLLHVQNDALIGPWMGNITAVFLIGAAIGGVLFGWLGDKIGRVRAMMLSILAYSIFTGCCYFIQSPRQLAVFRFLSALGMGGEWSLGVALVMECWPEKHRPMLAGAIGAAANVGMVLIGALGVAFAVTRDSWRWVMLAGAAPAILALFIAFFVPESEAWKKAVRAGGTANPFREIFSSARWKTTVLGIVFASIPLIGTWGAVQWIPMWADQMAGESARHAKGVTQVLLASGAVFGCFFGPLMGGRLGRRQGYFMLCVTSLLSCAYLFRFVHSYDTSFLVMAFLVGGFTGTFYGWLPLYLPELFPTRVRATGQGLCYNTGRILSACGALKMGWLLQQFEGSYAKAGATISLIYIAGLALIWLAPETKGKPLPE